ncbi:MAG: group III truncated hemoglobin [bacterium]
MRNLRITVPAPPSGSPPPQPGTDLDDAGLSDLLVAFYARVGADPVLASYFAPLDMAAHMPRIVAFWSTMMFHTGRYSDNAFKPHLEMRGLTAQSFDHWMRALEETIDARYCGPNAERMKTLGHRVAYSMQVRLGITPFAEMRDE